MNTMELEASRLLESGKLVRSELLLKKMLAADPNSVAAHFHLARLYRRMKNYDLALKHARRTLKLNPEEKNAWLNLGLIYEESGKGNLAIRFFKKEMEANPDELETLWQIGRSCFKRHHWLEARKYLHPCLERGYLLDIEDTVYKLGQCCCKLRDLDGYIQVYKRFLEMAPNTAWAAVNLGYALLRAKRYYGAVLWLTRAHELGCKKNVLPELERVKRMAKKSKGIITI